MNVERSSRHIHLTYGPSKGLEALEHRLKAYNKSSAQSKPGSPPGRINQHFEITTQKLAVHPISGDSLLLSETLAVDFARDVPAKDLLFFDLESTGLGSGEQIYPFLIGFAVATPDGVAVTACFATTPAGESEILAEFIAAARGRTLVSFNGKSFDLPLIVRRAEKYNLPHSLRQCPHIDLYHLIRRIYPEKPARLADAETRLLAFSRSGDISGAEVAQAYFEYVRFEKSDTLKAICDHNLVDVVSLVSLAAKVSTAFVAARSGRTTWAYKIHRDKSAAAGQQKELLMQNFPRLDARDLAVLGKILRSEKQYAGAARLFFASYRAGYASAIVDAVRTLRRQKTKSRTADFLVYYALAHEDDRVQKKLIAYL